MVYIPYLLLDPHTTRENPVVRLLCSHLPKSTQYVIEQDHGIEFEIVIV